ncbi:MAG: hypothetical protein GY772_27855, partial [bacterium]|nr:hypothetical protein [bacterium]
MASGGPVPGAGGAGAGGGGAGAVLTLADLQEYHHGGQRCSVKRAHKHLKHLREEMAPGGVEADPQEWSRDITDEGWVKAYICSRPDAQELIGEGIYRVEAQFLTDSWDHNMLQPRFDLVLTLPRNGRLVHARIHPSGASHGVAVFGEL